jgi:hypothetical protein
MQIFAKIMDIVREIIKISERIYIISNKNTLIDPY